MKIIILGAGRVGTTIAEHLATEQHDITIVDNDNKQLQLIAEHIDLNTVTGDASLPNVLLLSGIKDADLLIAVTRSDAINLLACQIATAIGQVDTKIARLRSKDYLKHPKIFSQYVDVTICPEQLITNYINNLIKHPEALQILDFANNALQLVVVKATNHGTLVNCPVSAITQVLPNINMRIVAIYRSGVAINVTGNTEIKENDEVFFLTIIENINTIITKLKSREHPSRNIIIAGAGNVGSKLAQCLDSKYYIKVIDHDLEKIKNISPMLKTGIALHGEAAGKNLLIEEDINNTDLFCAVTNSDEANIMSSLLAKKLGAKKTIALVNRPAYQEIIPASNIDVAISPQQITISSLLAHIRRGDIANVYTLRNGVAEAIEVIAHGDKESSHVIGKAISEIPLPQGTIIGAIVRDAEVIMGHHDIVIQAQDHIILFVTDKTQIPEIELIFQNAQ